MPARRKNRRYQQPNRHNSNSREMLSRPVLGVLLCFALGANPHAHADDVEEIIKYRQNVMLSQRANMAAAMAIAKGKVEFGERLLEHARALEAKTKNIPQLFPRGSDKGKTKALPAIWQDNEEFVKRAKDNEQKARALVQTIERGDRENAEPALKTLLKSCKSCHQDFRKKKKKN